MSNIGFSEWDGRISALILAAAQDARPFVLSIGFGGRLTIEPDRLYGGGPSASISLESGPDCALCPAANIESASMSIGPLERAQVSVDQMQDLIRVTRRIYAPLSGLRVWSDDKIPCDSCSAKGTTRGGPCPRCNGTGFRSVVPA